MKLFFTFVALGLALRLWQLNIPLLEFYPSRQVQTAEITQNIVRDNLNFLYPKLRYLGANGGYYLIEFPGYNLAVAIFSKLHLFSLELSGRILSIVSYVVASVFLFLLVRERVGLFVANVTVFFFSLSPLNVLTSRSFLPEEMMIASSIGSLYFISRFEKSGRPILLLMSAILFGWAALLKITSLIFLTLPVVYFLRKSEGKKFLQTTVFYLLLVILPSALWYFHVFNFSSKIQTSSAGAYNIANWFSLDVFLNSKFYSNVFGFELNLVLGPVAILLFIIGLFSKLKTKAQFLYFWLFSVIVYFLAFNKHNMTHEYYHLPFLPIASIFAGVATERIISNLKDFFIPKSFLLFLLAAFALATMLIPVMSRAYKPIDRFSHVTEAASAVKRFSAPDDPVIGAMDAGPTLVYYADRAGWGFEINREEVAQLYEFYGVKDQKVPTPEEDLESYREKGAKIFAAGNLGQFESNRSFSDYMFSNYNVLEKTGNYIVFDIKRNKNANN